MSKRCTETAPERKAKKLKPLLFLSENFTRDADTDLGVVSNVIVEYLVGTESIALFGLRAIPPAIVTRPDFRLVCKDWNSRLRDSVIQTHLKMFDQMWTNWACVMDYNFATVERFGLELVRCSLGKWIDLGIVGLPHLVAEKVENVKSKRWASPCITRLQLERLLALEYIPLKLRVEILLDCHRNDRPESCLPLEIPADVLRFACCLEHINSLWEMLLSGETFKNDIQFQLKMLREHDPGGCSYPMRILQASARPLELIRECIENVGMNTPYMRHFTMIVDFLFCRKDFAVEDVNALPWRSLASKLPYFYSNVIGGQRIMPFQSIYVLLPEYLGQPLMYSYLVRCMAANLLTPVEYHAFCDGIKNQRQASVELLGIFKDVADTLNKKQLSTEEEILTLARSEYVTRKDKAGLA